MGVDDVSEKVAEKGNELGLKSTGEGFVCWCGQDFGYGIDAMGGRGYSRVRPS